MKVIICGAGQVGWQIARHLSGENNDVTVVDSNGELVRRATEALDVQGVAGFASYPDVLDKAGSYALQEHGEMLVDAVEGSRSNVVGLPVGRTLAALRHFAVCD